MTNKSWKDHLLASGLPLEQSVIGVLQTLGVSRPREYRYERLNEQGILTEFSIDVFASRMYDHALVLELLIECKYRHDSTRWVFVPDEFPRRGLGFSDAFVIMDALCPLTVDRKALDRYRDIYPLCYKGIEIMDREANPKTIEQAVQQLRYAVLENSITTLSAQVDEDMPLDWAYVQAPVIVTTAELWRIRQGVTLAEVRLADELTEIADQHEVLILNSPPDKTFQAFARRRFNDRLTEKERQAIDAKLQETEQGTFASAVNVPDPPCATARSRRGQVFRCARPARRNASAGSVIGWAASKLSSRSRSTFLWVNTLPWEKLAPFSVRRAARRGNPMSRRRHKILIASWL